MIRKNSIVVYGSLNSIKTTRDIQISCSNIFTRGKLVFPSSTLFRRGCLFLILKSAFIRDLMLIDGFNVFAFQNPLINLFLT